MHWFPLCAIALIDSYQLTLPSVILTENDSRFRVWSLQLLQELTPNPKPQPQTSNLKPEPQTSNLKPHSMTPKDLGYYFPAEFDRHRATWLSWPHKEASWPGKIHTIFPYYSRFVATLAQGEKVCININDEPMRSFAENCLKQAGADMGQIAFFFHPTNDAWCRDHGPAFLSQSQCQTKKVIVDWRTTMPGAINILLMNMTTSFIRWCERH